MNGTSKESRGRARTRQSNQNLCESPINCETSNQTVLQHNIIMVCVCVYASVSNLGSSHGFKHSRYWTPKEKRTKKRKKEIKSGTCNKQAIQKKWIRRGRVKHMNWRVGRCVFIVAHNYAYGGIIYLSINRTVTQPISLHDDKQFAFFCISFTLSAPFLCSVVAVFFLNLFFNTFQFYSGPMHDKFIRRLICGSLKAEVGASMNVFQQKK